MTGQSTHTLRVEFVLPQSESRSQSPALLEIAYLACSSGMPCDDRKTRVYADGRYVSEWLYPEPAKSGRYREVSIREEKKLESAELAELVSWAEQSDFLSAQPKYLVKILHHGSHITITYRNNGREKKVTVINFHGGSAEEKAKVPPSVVKLMRWSQPYTFPE